MIKNGFFLKNDIFKANLPPFEFKVYTYLIMRADRKSNTCFPSMTTIARDCGISETKARRAIQYLRENGFIDVTPRYVEADNIKRQTSNLYTILQ